MPERWRVMVRCPEGWDTQGLRGVRRYLNVTWAVVIGTEAQARAEAALMPGSFVLSQDEYERMPSFHVPYR